MSKKNTLSKSSTIVLSPGYLSSDIGNEKMILSIESGNYYGLNFVGATVWDLIQQPTKFDKIRDAVAAKYAIEPSQCESDILTLLKELATEGLIEVQDETVVEVIKSDCMPMPSCK